MATQRSPREIACTVVVDTLGRFVIQQRDDKPGIICPGQLALFGGHREADETFLECAVRELREELTYSVQPAQLDHLMSYSGPDLDIGVGEVRGEFFAVGDVRVDALIVTEGALAIVTPEEIGALESRFAPLPWLVLQAFLQKNGPLCKRTADSPSFNRLHKPRRGDAF